MQYRSFVNNYSIDKLQICIKRNVVNIAEHYVRAKSKPHLSLLYYYIVLCKVVEMQTDALGHDENQSLQKIRLSFQC